MLLAGAAVAATTWQRAGIVELHEPADGGSAGRFGAAHGAPLGEFFWYWPSAGVAPKGRYWAVFFGIGLSRVGPGRGGIGRCLLVLASPASQISGVESVEISRKLRKGKRHWAVLGGIFWYWPFSAGLDVLSAFFGWDFVNLLVVLAFFLRGKGGRREPGGGGDWSPDPKPSSQDLRPCKTGAATAAEARCTIKKRPWPLPKASSTQILT